ncbi:hypothetical protein FKB34_11210 [Glycocaulis profundi]|nr:hypothetical protein FKB34_11210 [Glycocaulis profundi]
MRSEAISLLKRHLARAEHVDVSQYQFINLDHVAAAAGGRWAELRERCFLSAQGLIERHADPDDLIIRCATGFLVVYANLSGPKAERLTTRMRGELAEFFLGHPDLKMVDVEATASRMSTPEFHAALERAKPEGVRPPARSAHLESALPPLAGALYEPLWDAHGEAVAIFHALPVFDGALPDRWRAGELADPARADEGLALFRALLDRAARDLSDLFAEGGRCAVMLPAAYGALVTARTRAKMIQSLRDHPEKVRRLIYVRVEQAPLDAPAAVIGEACMTLQSHCGKIAIHAPIGAMSLSAFTDTGAGLAGCTWGESEPEAGGRSVALFSALAARFRAAPYVDGVDTPEALKAALGSPARFLAGAAVAGPGPLRAPYRLKRQDLMARTEP